MRSDFEVLAILHSAFWKTENLMWICLFWQMNIKIDSRSSEQVHQAVWIFLNLFGWTISASNIVENKQHNNN